MNKKQKRTFTTNTERRAGSQAKLRVRPGSRAKNRGRRRELLRITEYLVSGGVYFWSGYAFFFVADQLLGWRLFAAKMSASVFGWMINYLLQRFWVFRDPQLSKHKVEVTGRYMIITLVDFFLDYAIVYGLVQVGITPYIGQFVSSGFFTVWNYLWYKLWVFTNRVHRKVA
jgi:putative flippase GtrA